jgi:hypothetical protein
MDENIVKSIRQGLRTLSERDLYDHKGDPAPNELAFKMLVLGVFSALGWKCTSELRVTKENGGIGYVDILAEGEAETWCIELKYYSLAYWFDSPAGLLPKNSSLDQKRSNALDRVQYWDKQKLKSKELFLQIGFTDSDLESLEPRQYKKLQNSAAVSLEVLVERAKEQVRNYVSDARKCVIIGAGPNCSIYFVE